MVKRSRSNTILLGILLAVCSVVALVLLYVVFEIVREYNELPSAAMFGVLGLIFVAAAIVCGVKLGRSKKATQ